MIKGVSILFASLFTASFLLGFGFVGYTQWTQAKALDELGKEPVVVTENVPVTRPQKKVYMMQREEIKPLDRIEKMEAVKGVVESADQKVDHFIERLKSETLKRFKSEQDDLKKDHNPVIRLEATAVAVR